MRWIVNSTIQHCFCLACLWFWIL